MSPALFEPTPPDLAVEIESGHVSAARLTWRGREATIAAHTVEMLPAGAVIPALAAANIADVSLVARAIAAAVSRVGGRLRRAALVVPDAVAKVSLVRFETVPPRASDLNELIRWQIRKTAPFPLEQAVVSFTPGVRPAEGGQEFVVTVARTDTIAQYEQACEQAGLQTGLVDLATFSIVNGVLASSAAPSGDWLLVHAASTYTTLTVMRGRDLIFFRNRDEDTEDTLADVVHQTAMYYEDRLKGEGFTRVLLAGGAALQDGATSLQRNLEERLGVDVEPVDPRSAAGLLDRIAASPSVLDALAPLVGILMRESRVA
jgi:type IV pilus assembly protein PilM